MRRAGLILGLALLAAASLPAMEKASAQAVHERMTADTDQVSLKPVFLFDMRGRKDPFVPYALLTATSKVLGLSIRQMQFVGVISMNGQALGLFSADGKSYTLKASRLFGPDGEPVEGIRGRLVQVGQQERVATLEQGEDRMTFSDRRVSKRLEDQHNHD